MQASEDVKDGDSGANGGPLIDFGAFVVLPDKDGDKGDAKMLGSAKLNLGRYATRMRNGETIRVPLRFERVSKDGQTELVVGRLQVDLHIVGVGNGIVTPSPSLRSMLLSGANMPSLTRFEFHAYGVTVNGTASGKGGDENNAAAAIKLPKEVRLEFRVLSNEQRMQLSSIKKRVEKLFENGKVADQKQLDSLVRRFGVVWKKVQEPVHVTKPLPAGGRAAFLNETCALTLTNPQRAANVRVDVVDASQPEWTSLGSCCIPLNRVDAAIQYRFAMRLAPCAASVAKFYATGVPRVQLHAHLEVGRSPQEQASFAGRNASAQLLEIECSDISAQSVPPSANVAVVVGIFCPDANDEGLSGLGWTGHFPEVDDVAHARTQCKAASVLSDDKYSSTSFASFDVDAEAPRYIDSRMRNKVRAAVLEFGGKCLAEVIADLPALLGESRVQITDDAGSSAVRIFAKMMRPRTPEVAGSPMPQSGGFQSLHDPESPTARMRPPPVLTKPSVKNATPRATQQQLGGPQVQVKELGAALSGIREIQREIRVYANDAVSKQLLVDRLLEEVDRRSHAIQECGDEIVELRERNKHLEEENARLHEQLDDRVKGLDTDAGIDDIDVAGMNAAEAKQRLVLVARRYRSEKARNDEIMKRLQAVHAQTLKKRAMLRRYGELERAHQAQAKFILKLQNDISKVEACKSTVKMQERVIEKLERVLKKRMPRGADGAQSKVKVQALEEQLVDNARAFAQEIATLKLRIMELETDASLATSRGLE